MEREKQQKIRLEWPLECGKLKRRKPRGDRESDEICLEYELSGGKQGNRRYSYEKTYHIYKYI